MPHNSDLIFSFLCARVDTRFPVETYIVVGGRSRIEFDKDVFDVEVIEISNATQDSFIARNIVGVVQGNRFGFIPSELPAFGGVETHFRNVIIAIRVPHLQGKMYS